jgi:hypothetical protein
MNNDIIVPSGWLGAMLRALADPAIGIVGPRSNNVSGVQQINVSYGSDMNRMEAFTSARMRRYRYMGFESVRAVGFCMLVKRDVITAIGGFDTSFGIGNYEDDDFCLRAQLAGYKIWIADDAFVHHDGSSTFRSSNINYAKLMEHNYQTLRAKWYLEKTLKPDNIPYEKMLLHPFHKQFHKCPLTVNEVAVAETPPLVLDERRSFHFLITPRWKDPADRWLEAVRAFVTAFRPHDDVGLIIRIDPLQEPDIDCVIDLIAKSCSQAGIDLDQGHMILVVCDPIAPPNKRSLYKCAQTFIITAPGSEFRVECEEARACGLSICNPTSDELTKVLSSSKKEVCTFQAHTMS